MDFGRRKVGMAAPARRTCAALCPCEEFVRTAHHPRRRMPAAEAQSGASPAPDAKGPSAFSTGVFGPIHGAQDRSARVL